MGINTKYYKVLAMVISAVICSIAGSFQAVFASMVSPELLNSTKSISILTMVVIGGRRSIKGMILGGVFMMRFRPQGIWGVTKKETAEVEEG